MNANYLNLTEITKQVKVRMRDAYPAYPVIVQSSPDDMLVLCVRVFAVPENQIDEVQDFIFDLQDSLIIKTEAMLLPMVKNIKVTRQYYPEYILPEPAATVARNTKEFPKTVQEPNNWRAVSYLSFYVSEYYVPSMKFDFDLLKIGDKQSYPLRSKDNEIAANNELAFAA